MTARRIPLEIGMIAVILLVVARPILAQDTLFGLGTYSSGNAFGRINPATDLFEPVGDGFPAQSAFFTGASAFDSTTSKYYQSGFRAVVIPSPCFAGQPPPCTSVQVGDPVLYVISAQGTPTTQPGYIISIPSRS